MLPQQPANSEIKSVSKIVYNKKDREHYIYYLDIDMKNTHWITGSNIRYTFLKSTLSKFMSNFSSLRDSSSRDKNLHNIMPTALRAVLPDGTYIFERPPFELTVRFTPVRASRASSVNEIQQTVWLPWTVYVMMPPAGNNHSDGLPYNMAMYFSSSRIYTEDQTLYPALLPNIFDHSALICFGNDTYNISLAYSKMDNPTVKDVFSLMTNTFFAGGYNTDLLPSHIIPQIMRYEPSKTFEKPEHAEQHARIRSLVAPFARKSAYASVATYINFLKMWSNMTLEEVLDVYSGDHEIPHYSTTSISKLMQTHQRSTSRYFANVFNSSTNFLAHSESIYTHRFETDPIHNQSDVVQRTQEEYYDLLEKLIVNFDPNTSDDEEPSPQVSNDFDQFLTSLFNSNSTNSEPF